MHCVNIITLNFDVKYIHEITSRTIIKQPMTIAHCITAYHKNKGDTGHDYRKKFLHDQPRFNHQECI